MRACFVLFACLFLACKSDSAFWQRTESGTLYHIYENVLGAEHESIAIKTEDRLRFHLKIMNSEDSTIVFDSQSRIDTLEFEFTPVLFNGAFREVVPLLQVGDSVVMAMPARQFYGKSFPEGLERGDSIQCAMKLIEIKPPRE